MKINKRKLTATFAIVLLTLSAFLTMVTPLLAQDEYENMQEGGSEPLPSGVTPDATVATTSYLSFRPNPIGQGQVFLVNLWITPPPHVSRYFSDYKVTIKKPGGAEEVITIDSYRGDATAWFEYLADEVGEWTLKFDFQGGYFPPGNYTVHAGAFVGPQVVSFEESVYYEPSSTEEQTLTVQEDMVYSWPYGDLPTDYWERPVSPEHRAWWPILGSYPATGIVGGGPVWDELYPETNIYAASNPDCEFIPYVQAPNTAHVLWKRQGSISGLIGGTMGQTSLTSGGGTPNIIYAGRCYDTLTKVVNGELASVFQCYDLRTGEIYWERTDMDRIPTMLYYGTEARATVPGGGAYPGGIEAELMYVGGGRVTRYSPWDGAMTFNMSISPLSSGTYYNTYPFFLTVQNLGGGNYRLINWTLAGTHVASGYRYEYELGVISNISWPWSNLGTSQDFEAGYAITQSGIALPQTGVSRDAFRLRGASLETGAELWDITVEEPYYSSSCIVADHGKVAILSINGYFLAYNLNDGSLAWEGEAMDYPWSQSAFGAYDITSAYGMFYRQAYDGVYAFDWDDGSIVWHYKAPTPFEFETPYVDSEGKGVYSFNSGAFVADGKLFTYNSEHTTTEPVTRGWQIHCIDAITGEGIWNMSGPMSPGAVADGYLTASSSYDGYMYVFGKGKSSTTVTTPDIAVPKGTAMTIKGTVLDMSPAQPGTPCVSKESMTTQMEYLHMQRPIDGIKGDAVITGVPVTLAAIGSNGESYNIGTTITSGYSGAFGLTWTPTSEGLYEIIASFEGDDSYGSSMSSTFVTIGPAPSPAEPETEPPTAPPTAPPTEPPTAPPTEPPTAPPTEPPTTEPPTTEPPTPEALAFPTTEVIIVVAVAVAVVIGIGAYWALRKLK